MDAVYNRHVLGPKTTLNLFFPSSGNTPEMVGMSQRLAQFSMLNPFLLLQRNAPQIDTFYYVKVVLFCSFLFDIMPAKWMHFYVKGVVNFDFLWDTMPSKWMFFVACSMWHPCLVESKCIPQGRLSRQMVSRYHFFYREMPQTWMPFVTVVLNVSLQNAPDMDVS